jgi:hypothetical protein
MMEFAGTLLQLIGAVVTAFGLFVAWDRAANVFAQWRQGLAELGAKLIRPPVVVFQVESHIVVTPEFETSTKVYASEPTPEQRLEDVEKRLKDVEKTLAGVRGDTTEEITSAVRKSLAEFDAKLKAFTVEDIYPALTGIGIGIVGTFLVLIAQITC